MLSMDNTTQQFRPDLRWNDWLNNVQLARELAQRGDITNVAADQFIEQATQEFLAGDSVAKKSYN